MTTKEQLMSDCEQVLAGANACSEHATGLEMKDIKKVVAAHYEGAQCYAESSGEAVVLLKDGRYAVIDEWEDTTGHG